MFSLAQLINNQTGSSPDGQAFSYTGTFTMQGGTALTLSQPFYNPGDIIVFALVGGPSLVTSAPYVAGNAPQTLTVQTFSGDNNTYTYLGFPPPITVVQTAPAPLPVEPITPMLEPASVYAGDSITAHTGTTSIQDFLTFFLMGRLVPILGSNQGVVGDTTTLLLARQSVGLALNPVFYSLWIGTNDIVVGGKNAAFILANIQILLNNALATPSIQYICLSTVLARDDPSFNANIGVFQPVLTAVNVGIRQMAATSPKVVLCDYDLSTWNPTPTTSGGTMSDDGLHPNNIGTVVLARFKAAVMQPYVAPTDVLANTVGNLMPTNGDLAGTGGGQSGSTGQVATGYQVRQFIGGITGVNSKGTLDGHVSQIMTLNGTASANGFCELRAAINYTGSTGEVYEYLERCRITGTTNFANAAVACDGTLGLGGGTVTLPLDQDMDGIFRPQRAALSAPATQNVLDNNFSVVAGAVTNLKIEVAQPIWRKVA